MVINRFFISALFFAAVTVSTHAVEDFKRNFLSDTSSWEVGVTGDYAMEGENGDNTKSAMGFGLRGAYRFIDYYSAVLEYKYWPGVEKKGGGESTDIQRVAVSLNADLWPEKKHTPYLIVGLGYEYYEDEDALGHENGLITNLGFGYRYMIFSQVSIVTEAKWRLNITQEHDDGTILTLGANYHF